MAKHGTIARYNSGKCRCDKCRAAKASQGRRLKENRLSALSSGTAPELVHGKASTYVHWNCRCKDCRAAHNACSQGSRNRAATALQPEGKITHGTPGAYSHYGCRCETCIAEKSRALQAIQCESARSAHRNGYAWTGPELEIAERSDLTAREVAQVLGRTYAAVASMRRKLRYDPKTINLAGINPSIADR